MGPAEKRREYANPPVRAPPRVKLSILINISCNENIFIRRKLLSRRNPETLLCLSGTLYVCDSLDAHLGKMGSKHLVIRRQNGTGFTSSAWKVGADRRPEALRSTNRLARPLTRIPIHKPSFMSVLLGPPSTDRYSG